MVLGALEDQGLSFDLEALDRFLVLDNTDNLHWLPAWGTGQGIDFKRTYSTQIQGPKGRNDFSPYLFFPSVGFHPQHPLQDSS